VTLRSVFRPLTPAQERVARMVAKGYGYSKIAHDLNLSRHTVRTHVRTIAMLIDGYDPDVSYYNTVMLWASDEYVDTAA